MFAIPIINYFYQIHNNNICHRFKKKIHSESNSQKTLESLIINVLKSTDCVNKTVMLLLICN